MQCYRDSLALGIGIRCYDIDVDKLVINHAKPTPTDFRCDVDLVLRTHVHADRMSYFRKAYIELDSMSYAEQDAHARKVMGESCLELEQSLGATFIKLGIYPTRGKMGYFTVVRQVIK